MQERVIKAVRGAVCATNDKDSIAKWSVSLFNEVVKVNEIAKEDLVSIQFSLTKDLDKLNPCTALRRGKVAFDVSDIPLFCTQEAYIDGGLEGVIRLLLTLYTEKERKMVSLYLNGAEKLRPDIKGKEE